MFAALYRQFRSFFHQRPRTPQRVQRAQLGVQELEQRDCPSAIPGLVNTGMDSHGQLLTPGAPDAHYRIISAPAPDQPGAAVVVIDNGFPFNGYWPPDSPSSKWIGPHANENDFSGGVTEPVGNYIYETKFDLTGLDPSTASITGQVSADNTLVHVFLNGIDVGNASTNAEQYRGFTPLSITTGFVAGVNTLDFVVTNLPQTCCANNAHNPSAFRAELSGSANYLPPVAVPDSYTLTEDQKLKVNAGHGVLVNDIAPNGDPLVAQLVTGPIQGHLTLRSDGSLMYRPDRGFDGTDSATYQAVDAKTGLKSRPTLIAFKTEGDGDEKKDDVTSLGGIDLGFAKTKVYQRKSKPGMLAEFFPADPKTETLADLRDTVNKALKTDKVDHLNWYQIYKISSPGNVVPEKDNPYFGPNGQRLKYNQWYIDPAAGGERDGTGKVILWADQRPWYWNETAPPAGIDTQQNRDDGVYRPGAQLDQNMVDNNGKAADITKATRLKFSDLPNIPIAGLRLDYKTWLVALDKNGNAVTFLGGFAWSITSTKGPNGLQNEIKFEKNLDVKTERGPSDAEYKDLLKPQGFA